MFTNSAWSVQPSFFKTDKEHAPPTKYKCTDDNYHLLSVGCLYKHLIFTTAVIKGFISSMSPMRRGRRLREVKSSLPEVAWSNRGPGISTRAGAAALHFTPCWFFHLATKTQPGESPAVSHPPPGPCRTRSLQVGPHDSSAGFPQQKNYEDFTKSLACKGWEVTSSFKDEQQSSQSQLLGLMQLIKQTIKPFLFYQFCVFRLGLSKGSLLQRCHPQARGPPAPSNPGKPRLVLASSLPRPYQRLSSLYRGSIMKQPHLPDLRWVPGAVSNLLKWLRSLSPSYSILQYQQPADIIAKQVG